MAVKDVVGEFFTTARMLEDVGDFTSAIALYREYLAADPDDYCGAVMRLAAYGLAKPSATPVAYTATLFDQHAEDFDHILVERLAYDVPALMRRLAEPHLGGPRRLLDLGCGTGLVGANFNDVASESIGVDVAEKMLEMADARRVYDDLYVGEAVRFMAEWDEAPFGLIIAADVWPYIGDLGAFATAAAACLTPGGLLMASSERAEPDEVGPEGWGVTGTQRFMQTTAYVRATLEAAGFEIVDVADIIVRIEDGDPVPGDIVLARLPG